MDMGIRGWMIVVGVLLILAVLLDGYRRIRKEQRGKIKMSMSMGGGFDDSDLENMTSAELPNGGARVLPRAGAASSVKKPLAKSDERKPPGAQGAKVAASRTKPTQAAAKPNSAQSIDTAPTCDDDLPSMSALDTGAQNTEFESMAAKEKPLVPERTLSANGDVNSSINTDDLQDLLIINVMAKDEAAFDGQKLLQIFKACDLRIGNMNIFHRYEEEGGMGPVQFSIANIVEPGTFNMESVDTFNTPGICFFLRLPGPRNASEAFDCMLETAQCVAKNLGGELQDEVHSVVNNQTLAHWRQRIGDYKRRTLVQPA